MPRYTIHQNPGLIDLKAFTTFGVNSKPQASSPIGYFGTGLKYAIAVLARHRCPTTLWIGETPHIFEARETTFRDKQFLQLYMRRQRGPTSRWFAQELPFTTELGKNWELWMAYRELHANALDEQGTTCQEPGDETDVPTGIAGMTRIIVKGEAYAQIHAQASEIFLDSNAKPQDGIRLLRTPSRYAYYRGLRVAEHHKPAIMTWDIHHRMTLTEDRTLAATYMLQYYAAGHILRSTDRDLIQSALRASEETFEGSIDWDSYRTSFPPSQEFIQVARTYGRSKHTTVIVTEANRAECKGLQSNWQATLSKAIENDFKDAAWQIITEHKHELLSILSKETSK